MRTMKSTAGVSLFAAQINPSRVACLQSSGMPDAAHRCISSLSLFNPSAACCSACSVDGVAVSSPHSLSALCHLAVPVEPEYFASVQMPQASPSR